MTHMWKGAETAESYLTLIFKAVEKEALRMAVGNKRCEGTAQVFKGLWQGSAVLKMRRDQSRLAHTEVPHQNFCHIHIPSLAICLITVFK